MSVLLMVALAFAGFSILWILYLNLPGDREGFNNAVFFVGSNVIWWGGLLGLYIVFGDMGLVYLLLVVVGLFLIGTARLIPGAIWELVVAAARCVLRIEDRYRTWKRGRVKERWKRKERTSSHRPE